MKTYLSTLTVLSVLLFTSCFNDTSNKAKNDQIENDSIEVIKKVFETSPDKIEYEIPILKGTKLRHGLQKRYYLHGSIYSEIPYKRNKREGIAYTYYKAYNNEKPIVWKEQPYVNGLLEGTCRRYHSDGQLQSEYEYSHGLPAIGLKEYSKSGKEISQPTLIVEKTEIGGNIYIAAHMSNNTKKVKFYSGNLIEGKYVSENMKKLPLRDGVGEMMLPFTTSLKQLTIVAEIETRYSNKYYTAKTIQLK